MQPETTTIIIRDLHVPCRIGVPITERKKQQIIQINIRCELDHPDIVQDAMSESVDYAEIIESVQTLCAASVFVLLETLVAAIAQECFTHPLVARATVRAEKLQKVPSCTAVGVERVFRRDVGIK